MNNGLSGSTASIKHRTHRTNWVRSPFSAVQFSAVKWLASALCAMGLASGALPVMAQAVIAQADTEAAPPLPPTAAPTATPAAEEALPDEPLPDEPLPEETSSPQPIPELPPIQPTEQPPSILIDPPATDDSTTDNPVDTPVRRSGATNQIPTLPPQASPRFEEPLIIPNTVVTPSDLQPAFDSYHLGPGDSIFISVQRYPDLSFQATLDLQGNVVVPLQGAVPFEGLTIAEAEELLRRVYNQYVVIRETRDVSITLVAQRGVEVTVLGSVQRPGFYPLADPTVSTALLTAGGATRTSDLRDIQVQRRVRRGNGLVEETVNVDLFTPLKEGSPLPDVRLEDGDVVIIPEIDPSELNEYDRYLVSRSTLAQPIINVRFLNYAGGRSNIGTLNINNGSTFLDAVSLLGVSPDTARLGEVALIRYDRETGRAVTISLDAKSAIQGDITQNPPLEDSDVIIVGRNLVGRISFALQTITRPFRDVFGFTNFIDNAIDNDFFR